MFGVMTRRVSRFLASAAIVAAAGAMAAPAAMAQEFRGGGFLSDLDGCDGVNLGTGIMVVTARYRPGELPGNDDTALSIADGFGYSFSLHAVDGIFESTFSPVRGVHLVPSDERIRPMPRVRVLRQIPNEIDDDTDRMRLRLMTRNLFDIQGCRAVIDLEMRRW